jgi:hypothetical protein
MGDDDPKVAGAIADTLGDRGGRLAIDALKSRQTSRNPEIKKRVQAALQRLGVEPATPAGPAKPNVLHEKIGRLLSAYDIQLTRDHQGILHRLKNFGKNTDDLGRFPRRAFVQPLIDDIAECLAAGETNFEYRELDLISKFPNLMFKHEYAHDSFGTVEYRWSAESLDIEALRNASRRQMKDS